MHASGLACKQVGRLMKPILCEAKPQSMQELHGMLIKSQPIADAVGKFIAALNEPVYSAATMHLHTVLSKSESPYSFEVQKANGSIVHSTWMAATVLFLHAIAVSKGLSREQRDAFLDRVLNREDGDEKAKQEAPAVSEIHQRIKAQMLGDIPAVERFYNQMLDGFKSPAPNKKLEPKR